MKLATTEEQNAMPAVSSGEFMHLPLNLITVTSQIRSSNDMGGIEARRTATPQAAVVKADTVAGYRRSFKNVRMSLQQQKGQLTIQQADVILADLKDLVALVEQLRAASITVSDSSTVPAA